MYFKTRWVNPTSEPWCGGREPGSVSGMSCTENAKKIAFLVLLWG